MINNLKFHRRILWQVGKLFVKNFSSRISDPGNFISSHNTWSMEHGNDFILIILYYTTVPIKVIIIKHIILLRTFLYEVFINFVIDVNKVFILYSTKVSFEM